MNSYSGPSLGDLNPYINNMDSADSVQEKTSLAKLSTRPWAEYVSFQAVDNHTKHTVRCIIVKGHIFIYYVYATSGRPR